MKEKKVFRLFIVVPFICGIIASNSLTKYESITKIASGETPDVKKAFQIIIDDTDNSYGEDYDGYFIKFDVSSKYLFFEECMGQYTFDDLVESGGINDFSGLSSYKLDCEPTYIFKFEKEDSHTAKLVFPWYVKSIAICKIDGYENGNYTNSSFYSLSNTNTLNLEGYTNDFGDERYKPAKFSDPVTVVPNVYTLSVETRGTGKASISDSTLGSNKYYERQKITLTASEENFDYWEADGQKLEGKGATFTTYAKSNVKYTAVFKSSGLTAEQFATNFNETFEGKDSKPGVCLCDEHGVVSTKEETLKPKWNDFKDLFNDESFESQRSTLQNATANKDSENVIERFAAKYDYIFHKYGGVWSLTNYIGRSVSTMSATPPFVSNISDVSSGSNTPILIVLITILCSTLSIGGYFLIKRKREE